MEWIKNTKDFLLLDGRQLAAEIRAKPENSRKLWEKAYLWFHDNFEMIIIVGGIILLGLLIYNYLDAGGCQVIEPLPKMRHQKGGNNEKNNNSSTDSDTPTPPSPGTTQKTKDELRADAILAATKAAEETAAAKEAKKAELEKEGTEKKPGLIKRKADENRLKVKTFVKNIKGNTIGKASAAWQSVKSGEALELGKEKFADALYNSKDFVRQYAKAGYALAFTTFMVIGFGLFFVPTLIMFIIGGITLAIFNKQKMAFLANT